MKIYLLENSSGQKYVGKTTTSLKQRFCCHLCPSNDTSSKLMDPEPNKITLLEDCEDCISFERERYWINQYDTINILRLDKDKTEYNKVWNVKNKEWYADYHKRNKDKRYDQQKQRRAYQDSWGGQLNRGYHNLCMLRIDVTLFS
tara:strand:- start:39 stop:473 length:435 start_codon:yes stop_codon:yes gene_type:complete